MAKHKTTIRFELRKDKVAKDGMMPIRLIYQIRGQRKYFNTSERIYPHNWQEDTQEAIYLDKAGARRLQLAIKDSCLLTQKEIQGINFTLRALKEKIGHIESTYISDGVSYSAAMVIESLNEKIKPATKKDDPHVSIPEFILKRFVPDSKDTHRTGTLKVYIGLANHLHAFEKQHKTKVAFASVNIPFLKAFQTFLVYPRLVTSPKTGKAKTVKMNNTTAAKQISTLKSVLTVARVDYKINVPQDYRDFSLTRKDGRHEVVVLTQPELQRVIDLDLAANPRLDKVRDIFVFSCATGLRISDLHDLNRSHIKEGAITKTAIKTGQQLSIPLNAISSRILKKYSRNILQPLPMITEQKINLYLKEVGELAEINTMVEKIRVYGVKRDVKTVPKHELMTIHMGRRTFTTHCLEKGISRDETMKMTGHSTYSSFKRYVDISNETIKESMRKAWGEPGEVQAI